MDETAFTHAALALLERLENALEGSGVEMDIEPKPGGVLEVSFENGSRLIINRHTAAREIWVAAKSGGFHFRLEGARWVNTRDGEELFSALSRLASEQSGQTIDLKA
jgi:CyaY protein